MGGPSAARQQTFGQLMSGRCCAYIPEADSIPTGDSGLDGHWCFRGVRAWFTSQTIRSQVRVAAHLLLFLFSFLYSVDSLSETVVTRSEGYYRAHLIILGCLRVYTFCYAPFQHAIQLTQGSIRVYLPGVRSPFTAAASLDWTIPPSV